jgi:hypothetical protein
LAKALGIKLTGFICNDKLELYYNIEKEGNDIGFISKGWDDPGFRVGNLITIKLRDLDLFRKNSDKILNTYATQLVACGVRIIENQGLELDLTIPIYQCGLNESVLKNVLETLESTINKIRTLLN